MKHCATRPGLLLLVPVLALLLAGCDFDKGQFIGTAKDTFASFYNNSGITDSTIDWRSVKINDEDVGQSYVGLTTDYEKAAFRKAEVSRLRSLCSSKGWTPEKMKDWRIKDRGVESATVVADGPGGSVIMSMRKYGAEKRIGYITIR